MSIVIGKKIKLELINESHAKELFILTDRNREYLRKWLPWVDGTRTVKDTIKFIKYSVKRNKTGVGFENVIKYDGNIAGTVGLLYINNFNKKTEIGYWLANEFTGKGIMTKACSAVCQHCFHNLNLNRIEIRCAVKNKASRGIPERLHFKKEGVLRKEVFLNGQFLDHILFAMLREEWNM